MWLILKMWVPIEKLSELGVRKTVFLRGVSLQIVSRGEFWHHVYDIVYPYDFVHIPWYFDLDLQISLLLLLKKPYFVRDCQGNVWIHVASMVKFLILELFLLGLQFIVEDLIELIRNIWSMEFVQNLLSLVFKELWGVELDVNRDIAVKSLVEGLLWGIWHEVFRVESLILWAPLLVDFIKWVL